MTHKKRIAIVGGGITGLAAAYHLKELDSKLDISLWEAANRWGGVIESECHDGFLCEGGPDAFISEKPWALQLIRRLGLEDQLVGTNPKCRKSYILRKGNLVPVPEGFYLIAPNSIPALIKTSLISPWGKLRMAGDLIVPAQRDIEDESVASFIRRRLGQEALERLGQPMISGIHTADPEQLSLKATMPQFHAMERNHGGVIKALAHRRKERAFKEAKGPRYSLFLTLRGGMETLVKVLLDRLQKCDLHLNSSVESLRPHSQTWHLRSSQGKSLNVDAVCLALPAHQAARLVHTHRDLSQELCEIPYASVATLNLIYDRNQIQHSLDGFGFVVPQIEKRGLVACTFSSVKFPERSGGGEKVLLRAFLGGALQPEVFDLSDEKLKELAHKELADILGIEGRPIHSWLRRYPRSMPQYHVGHEARIDRIDGLLKDCPGLFLTGSAFRGVGIPDCIRQGEAAAETIVSYLQQ